MDRRYVALAEVARPHGIAGELRLKIYNEESDLLLRRPVVRLRFPDGTERDLRLASARPTNRALLVRFEGVDDRTAVEALRGAVVSVARDTFAPLDDGEFYACDVEGARAMWNGNEVGVVSELRSYPTCDVLLIDRKGGGGIVEIPLLEQFVTAVDVEARVVELSGVEDLLA